MRGEHKPVSIEDVIDSINDALEENEKSESEFACVETQKFPNVREDRASGTINISEFEDTLWIPWAMSRHEGVLIYPGFAIRAGIIDRFTRSLYSLIGDGTEEEHDDN